MRTLFALALLLGSACGTHPAPVQAPADAGSDGPSGDRGAVLEDFVTRPVPSDPQRPGDPARGYRALVNEGYVPCGIPWTVFTRAFGVQSTSQLPGREGRNAMVPYNFTVFRNRDGMEVVSANCLTCHAGALRGRLVVGLGNAQGDFTQDTGVLARASRAFARTPEERAELDRWIERVETISDYTRTLTVGVNPADNLTAILIAHRHRDTLAWSAEPLLEPPPAVVVPVDVPPWWHLRRKNAMFYNASGRGDHARIMMTASTLCTDSVDEARRIDSYFPDIRAYIASLEPPPWPFPSDAPRASQGRAVFERVCSTCHGTYGEGGRYPNLLVGLREVGTDPTLALGAAQFAGRFVAWYNQSFYGELARIEPQQGYVPPPLDGLWATAPYLHNGSVPTLSTLLDSRERPRFWTRTFTSNDYDPDAVGWRFTALDHGHAGEPDVARRARIYDTTQPGYSNQGHTYGDALTPEERAAVIEYLKTL